MAKVGFIGWRGMVGSVLMQRMQEEGDFKGIEAHFFTTSNKGAEAPVFDSKSKFHKTLKDAFDIHVLAEMDIIISCQGGEYTQNVFTQLRDSGWDGHWIDAASSLRMQDDAVIILDPVNSDLLKKAFESGCQNWIGGNCTVSLMLMAINGLIKEDLVEWVSSMTYQAASGAGAQNMKELIKQMHQLGNCVESELANPSTDILSIDKKLSQYLRDEDFGIEKLSKAQFGVPLAGALIPWIDKDLKNGQSREEWKGEVETNKILGRDEKHKIVVDGLCVRIGTLRCHSQALTIKLKKDVSVDQIEKKIASGNEWVELIANEREESIQKLSPVRYSGSLKVGIGRIRKMKMGPEYISAFTVGDQLLWGAAEPLRRMLRLLLEWNA